MFMPLHTMSEATVDHLREASENIVTANVAD